MMDPIEWCIAAAMGAMAVLALVAAVMFAGQGYLAVKCYGSGDPDSMPCYMTNGKTSRVKADVISSAREVPGR